MTKNFSASIDDWVRQTEDRARAVFRQSAVEVVTEMQKVGPSVASTKAGIKTGLGAKGRGKNRRQIQGPVPADGEGGNMPVDSGFLRASLQVALNADPVLTLTPRPDGDGKHAYNAAPVNLIINGAELGDSIHAAYGASYAAAVEYGAGSRPPRRFVALAAMQWQQIVHRVTAQLKNRNGL